MTNSLTIRQNEGVGYLHRLPRIFRHYMVRRVLLELLDSRSCDFESLRSHLFLVRPSKYAIHLLATGSRTELELQGTVVHGLLSLMLNRDWIEFSFGYSLTPVGERVAGGMSRRIIAGGGIHVC